MRRRELIQATAASVAMGAIGTGWHLAQPALGIDPFDRPKPGKLRLSLAAYSLRKYLSPAKDEAKKMDLIDFVDFCFQQGIPGVELTSYYFPEQVTTEYLLKLKHCFMPSGTAAPQLI